VNTAPAPLAHLCVRVVVLAPDRPSSLTGRHRRCAKATRLDRFRIHRNCFFMRSAAASSMPVGSERRLTATAPDRDVASQHRQAIAKAKLPKCSPDLRCHDIRTAVRSASIFVAFDQSMCAGIDNDAAARILPCPPKNFVSDGTQRRRRGRSADQIGRPSVLFDNHGRRPSGSTRSRLDIGYAAAGLAIDSMRWPWFAG